MIASSSEESCHTLLLEGGGKLSVPLCCRRETFRLEHMASPWLRRGRALLMRLSPYVC